MIAMILKIKSILFSIRLNVSTQKLYGLWIIDLVTGGSLLNILNGAPIIKTKSRNGNDSIKIKIFLKENSYAEREGVEPSIPLRV